MVFCPFDRKFHIHDQCYCGFCYNRNVNYPNEPFHKELAAAVEKARLAGEQWLAAQSPETIQALKDGEEARVALGNELSWRP